MQTSCTIKTPFCHLKVSCQDDRIVAVEYMKRKPPAKKAEHALLKKMEQQVTAYSASPTHQFDLPIAPQGTEFQQRVWAELVKIPAGQVKTYGQIAQQLATSPRAVGNACRKNPVPLIIPCHRVVSQAGIGGFAGATDGEYLNIKRRLLKHEGVEI